MIDWEKIIKTDSAEELKSVKLWLFRENMRLENEKKALSAAKDKLMKEQINLCNELDELNRRTAMERKRLKEENRFFDQKMEILKAGFLELEQDRKALEKEKRMLSEAQKRQHTVRRSAETAVEALFRNADNLLALRKRYRDLVKIFHPDNLFGDAELMQSINSEFYKRKEEL